MVETPMCDKLAAEKWKTQLIHDFLEFAEERGIHLGQWTGDGKFFWPRSGNNDDLLAEFIGVDMNEVEREKQAILEDIRSRQNTEHAHCLPCGGEFSHSHRGGRDPHTHDHKPCGYCPERVWSN